MPTAAGLSASRTSLPRKAYETGALRVSERRSTSARACLVPSPPWITIFFAPEIRATALSSASSSGRISGRSVRTGWRSIGRSTF